MSIIRLIHIQLDPSENEKAEQVWKTECAPLMIQQKGCLSEKLLRARAAGEFISYSEWESEEDIERYMKSDAHKEILRHSRGLKGARAGVKLYELAQSPARSEAVELRGVATPFAVLLARLRDRHDLPRRRRRLD